MSCWTVGDRIRDLSILIVMLWTGDPVPRPDAIASAYSERQPYAVPKSAIWLQRGDRTGCRWQVSKSSRLGFPTKPNRRLRIALGFES